MTTSQRLDASIVGRPSPYGYVFSASRGVSLALLWLRGMSRGVWSREGQRKAGEGNEGG